jgi:hypothetical protein
LVTTGSTFASYLEQELRRELALDDPLRARAATCIAKNFTTDDVLFHLDDGTLTEVHLTFTRNPPERPGWPRRRSFDTLAEWVSASMIPEHAAHFGL